MDADRLDALARTLHGGITRRRGLAAFTATVAAGVGAVLAGTAEPEAKPRNPGSERKSRRRRCLGDGHRCGAFRGRKRRTCRRCCSGYAVPKQGPHRRCACRPDGNACGKGAQCCSGTCQDGRCAGDAPVCIGAGGDCPDGNLACCSGLSCQAGSCADAPDCGAQGEPCCAGETCDSGLACESGTCVPCGAEAGPCCAGNTCDAGLRCNGSTCDPCGAIGEGCCDGDVCDAGGTCDSGTCVQCGGNDDPCCAGACQTDLTCRDDDVCIPTRCVTPLETAGCTFSTITSSWTCDENVDLSTADLSGCDLRTLTILGSTLSGGVSGPATNFAGADLDGALFQTFSGRLTTFAGADLTGATFDSYFGGEASFANADLTNTVFSNGGSYVDADFTGTDVTSVTWGGSLTCPSGASLGTAPAGTCCTKWATGKEPAAGCT